MSYRKNKIRRRRSVHRRALSLHRAPHVEALEPRLLLHGDEEHSESWLDHILDDDAILNATAGNEPQPALIASAAAAVEDPSVVGQWSPLENFPIEFINAIMLPTGKVLGYDRTLNLRLWDPVTDAFSSPASPGYNVFCSGTALLADGSVLVTGGHVVDTVGLPFAAIYNPFNDSWTQLANMNDGRWYPSTTTLANGDALVLSGDTNGGRTDPLPQVYDYETGEWRDLTTAQQTLSFYPRTFSAPNGDAFVAGPDPLSQYLDTSGTGQWIPVDERVVPNRNFGSAVMYAPGKILYVGGDSPATNTAEVIDLTQPNPTWRAVGSMAYARRNCNATLLPDGEVLVTGGNTGSGTYDGDAITTAEIWNPQTETFRTVSSESDIRWYHSTALLLPDGRVLSTSGDLHLTGQVYSPSYLFEGTRPTITSAPEEVQYGDKFFVGTPDAANITNVRWIRLGSATHAQNWDQYMQSATFTQTAGGIMVSAPPVPDASPPGYYMLFILKGDVPSVASMVRVGSILPTLSISDVSVTEGPNGTTKNAVFTVTLDESSAKTITVQYATANGTALAGADYTAQTGILTFNPLVKTQTISVPITGDGILDPTETFTVNLSAAVGAGILKAQGQGLIRDYASTPVLQIKGATVTAPTSGTVNADFVVTLSSAPTTTPVTVTYTTVDGTGVAGKDYVATTDTLTFGIGVTQQTISVPVVGSMIDKPNNTFSVKLLTPVGATIETATAQGLIYNTAPPPTANLAANATVTEPGPGGTTQLIVTATLTNPSEKTVVVPWITQADGLAVAGRNFVSQVGSVVFPPGTTTQTFAITVIGDGVKRANVAFSIQMQSELLNAVYGNRYTYCSIVDSDTVPAITIGNAVATEGNAGTTNAVFTATLSAPLPTPVTVNYATSPGTALAGVDYTTATGTITFPANTTTQTINVPVIGNTAAQSNRTFNLKLSAPVGATLAVAAAVGTIVDDDGAGNPAAPTGLYAIPGFAAVALAWKASAGATSYNVYRSLTPNGQGTVPFATGVVGTAYTDLGLTNGTTYYYWVSAVKTVGGVNYEGTASAEVSAKASAYNFTTAENLRPAIGQLSLNGYNVENLNIYGSTLQLTDGGTTQNDSAFTLVPVNITRFATQFTFQQLPSFGYTLPLADGMTFAIQGTGPTALGISGGGLGYTGIAKSVAIKFDLFDNAGEGPNSTGLYTNGEEPNALHSINLTGTGIDLHSGHPFNVAMTYDGANLQVTISDTVTQAQAVQTYVVDIPAIVGGNTAFVGFTGGTGGLTAVQQISSWAFTPAPSAPTNLQAALGGAGLPQLSWTSTDPNATSVLIERKAGAAGTYAQIGMANAPANTFVDQTAVAGTTYVYRVRAANNGSTSLYSGEATLTAGTALPPNFPNGFAGAAGQFGFNGASAKIVGNNLQLTDGGGTEAASVFALAPVAVNQFATHFTIQQLSGTTPTADGMTFTIQGVGSAAAGGSGGGLGYAGIANSLAIKFDLFDNAGEGPNSTGLYTGGVQPNAVGSINLTGTGIDLHSGHTFAVDMTYDGTTLKVTITDTVTLAKSTQSYIVNIPALVGGNTAYVGFTGGTGGLTAIQNVLSWTYTPGTVTDLQITNTDNQATATPGTAIKYTIVVTNAGPSAVTGASITDTLPAALTGATFTATATGGATGFSATGSGNLAQTVNMPAGSTITYIVSATVSAAATGTLANTATVTAPAAVTDSNAANNSATDTDTVAATADLQITNTDNQTTAKPGAAISYTIVVANTGPGAVTGASVADTLPAVLTGATFTATATGGATGFSPTGAGNIAQTVNMPAGSTITYIVSATVSAAATGTLTNTATVTAPAGVTDSNAGNNSATDTDTLTPYADLQITNTDTLTTTAPGMPVKYTIIVTNAGPSNVTGAKIADTLPATLTGATYTATATGGATGFTATGSGNISQTVNMPAGSTIIYVVNATVSTTATGTLTNTATVTAPAGVTDSNAANNSATDSDTIATPALNYPNGFTGAASKFSFTGASAKIVGSTLQLTDGGKNEAASIYATTKVDVTRFATSFKILLANASADGMTFTIQNAGAKAIGGSGGNLAYKGIKTSVAVKFDLYNSSGEGPNSTGLYINGAAPESVGAINLTGTGIDLHSGHAFNVTMTYDGTTLQVTITDTVTGAKATQNYTVNIPSIVGANTAYVGFTGSTGGGTATQTVLNWTYTALPAPPAGATALSSAGVIATVAAPPPAGTSQAAVASFTVVAPSGSSGPSAVTASLIAATATPTVSATAAAITAFSSSTKTTSTAPASSIGPRVTAGASKSASPKSAAAAILSQAQIHDIAISELALED